MFSTIKPGLRKWAKSNGFTPAQILATEISGQAVGGAVRSVSKRLRSQSGDSGVNTTPSKKQKTMLTQKKSSTMTGKTANNVLVNKSSMVVKGKNKLKNRKKVEVSPWLRASIKQVMRGSTGRGTYTTLITGFIGSVSNGTGTNTSLAMTDLGQSVAAVLIPGSNNPTGSRTLLSTLLNQSVGAVPTVIAQSGMNYFTPAKILDAASVLFNSKALDNPYTQAGNLSETIVGSSGAAETRFPTLQIDIIDSSVVWRMKNVSNRIINLEIWECSPTLKFAVAPPLEQLLEQGIALTNITNDNPIRYATGLTTGSSQNFFYNEQGFDVLQVAKNLAGFPWAWKKRTMVLNPDETCVHTIKGPKGVLDFRRLVNTAANGVPSIQLDALVKGFSVGCIVSIVGDQVFKPSVTNTVGGRDIFSLSGGAGHRLGMPICVEVEEKYRIAVPEIAGFISANPAAPGQPQTLNLRKNRFIFWNKISGQAPTDTAPTGYNVSNEENPTAETLAGTVTQ